MIAETVHVLPDPVLIVTRFLREQPELAALVGNRVYSIVPAERRYPLVLVNQVADAPLVSRPWWATEADLQVSVYDGRANTARQLVELIRGLVAARICAAHPDGTVAWFRFANTAYLPDNAVLGPEGRPKPRWVTTLTVTVHPNP